MSVLSRWVLQVRSGSSSVSSGLGFSVVSFSSAPSRLVAVWVARGHGLGVRVSGSSVVAFVPSGAAAAARVVG